MIRIVTARLAAASLVALAACQTESPPAPPRAAAARPAAATATPAAPAPPPPPPAVDPRDLGDGTRVGTAVRYQHLTLLPIVATGAVDTTDYLVLDEGMKHHQVRIKERPDAEVNELTISNRSEKPLFLMAGEVVIGGQQDRIIGKNTIIAGKTTQAVPVFCVEHGRWDGRKAEFASAGALAHTELRGKASYDGQGDVWDEVASKNVKRHRDRDNDTGTYRGTAADQATGTLATWDQAIDAELATATDDERARTVGYAVALNGEVVAVDVFGGPGLLAKLGGKLRRSYYAEAIDAPVREHAAVAGANDVKAFLQRAAATPDEKVYDTDAADTLAAVGADTAATKVMRKGAPLSAKPVFTSTQKHAKKPAAKAWPPDDELNELGNAANPPVQVLPLRRN